MSDNHNSLALEEVTITKQTDAKKGTGCSVPLRHLSGSNYKAELQQIEKCVVKVSGTITVSF